jgi:hypothetical protein
MRRPIAAVMAALMLVLPWATEARAAINVQRSGDENPMKEVAKSVLYGALAGLCVGGALAVATEDNHNDDDFIRWGFAGGTLAGLGMGIYWVSKRPQPSALLEIREGQLGAAVPDLTLGHDGTARMRLVRVNF